MIINGIKYQSKEDLKIYRVIDIINHHYIIKCDDMEKKVTEQQLLDKYIKLIPDAFCNILLTDHKENPDVYICINKASELSKGNNIPDLILRQSLLNQYNNPDLQSVISFGDCITKYNNLSNTLLINYMQFTKIDYSFSIALYIDDTLDNIINLIPKKILDKINSELKYIKTKFGDGKGIITINGYEEDLKTLMTKLEFIARYREIFSILPIKWTIDTGSYDEDGNIILNDIQKQLIANIVGFPNVKIKYIIKYDNDIDSDQVKESALWLSDSNGVYIVDFV